MRAWLKWKPNAARAAFITLVLEAVLGGLRDQDTRDLVLSLKKPACQHQKPQWHQHFTQHRTLGERLEAR